MIPLEVWSRVVAHADFADVSHLHDVSVDLRQESLKRLHADPPTILVALENDSVVLMRASVTITLITAYLASGLIKLAIRHKARRVIVNFMSLLDARGCITQLVEKGWFSEAVTVYERWGITPRDDPHFQALELYMAREGPERLHILRAIMVCCKESFVNGINPSAVNAYLSLVHSRDLPDLVWEAASRGCSSVCLMGSRDSIVQAIVLQYKMGNKRTHT